MDSSCTRSIQSDRHSAAPHNRYPVTVIAVKQLYVMMFLFSRFDPLGNDPIVVTGSANFSDNSTTAYDKIMLIIRGDKRVADIYFTEFNRLFSHYYFRAVVESTARAGISLASPVFAMRYPCA
jgi:hypothetical protein